MRRVVCKNMEWYDDPKAVEDAITMVLDYYMVYPYSTFISQKTPCYNYEEEDINIPEDLKTSIKRYYRNLNKPQKRALNSRIATVLGERFFIKERSLVRLLSRILYCGPPNKDMLQVVLDIQIKQRKQLLEALNS